MTAPRFSLFRALAAIALAALFLAWARRYAGAVVLLTTTATFLALTILPLKALASSGPRKWFWVGFAAAGWAYATYHVRHSSGVLGWCPDLPSGRLLDNLYPRLGLVETQPPPGSLFLHGPPEYSAFHLLGQCVLCLLVASLGALLSGAIAAGQGLRRSSIMMGVSTRPRP
jgi:hypothetical protein